MSSFRLLAPFSDFVSLGEFQIEASAWAGETSLRVPLPLRPGTWRAWELTSEALDHLVEQGIVSEDEAEQQLLLSRADTESAAEVICSSCVRTGSVPIEGARFTVACDSLKFALETDDGFYEHLDGVHGILKNGRGVHLMLDGDGEATIWSDPSGTIAVIGIR